MCLKGTLKTLERNVVGHFFRDDRTCVRNVFVDKVSNVTHDFTAHFTAFKHVYEKYLIFGFNLLISDVIR